MKFEVAVMSVVVLVCLATVGKGRAQSFSGYSTNPVGQCDAALPAYDDMLRKRPTAIANTGDTMAFVSCSMPERFDQDNPSGIGPALVYIFFDDPSRTSNATVSCTLVAGVLGADAAPVQYYTQSNTFNAGSSTYRTIEFHAEAFGLERFAGAANLSCALPPGVEMNDFYIYDEYNF